MSDPVDLDQVRARQVYVVYTTLAHLPAFLDAPDSLRPPFRLLGQGDPLHLELNPDAAARGELGDRFFPIGTGRGRARFVPGMGRIVAGHEEPWALRARGYAGGRGHVPWLVEPNWRLRLDAAALDVREWPEGAQAHANASLAVHLYSYGLVAVSIRLALRFPSGLDWTSLVRLVRAASPFERERDQAPAYRLATGQRAAFEAVRAGEVPRRPVAHLARHLFASPTEYRIEDAATARLHTTIYLQETTPTRLDPGTHYPLIAALALGRARWATIADSDAQRYRRAADDIGHLDGDWIKYSPERLVIIAAAAGRIPRRTYAWRLHAWTELVRAHCFVAALSRERIEALIADPARPLPVAWHGFWLDLPSFATEAMRASEHPEAYDHFAACVGLERELEDLARRLARLDAVPRRPAASGKSEDVDLAALSELLMAALAPRDLRRICRDRAEFRDVLARVPENASLHDWAETLIDYAVRQCLVGELVRALAAENPAQYARFEERLRV